MADDGGLSGIGLIVGLGLVVFPEPATTATGLAIVAASLGLDALTGGTE